jgi:filamentous hemagglutinin family protein
MIATLPAYAQNPTVIRTDASWGRTPGSLSPSASNATVVGNRGSYLVPGNVYVITEAQGRLAGANLLHSFESFSVGAKDAAVFTTTTPSLQNVVSRVSGGSASTINGLLALVPAAGSAPNFFFINPNGVTFGASAQVDVPASFHVSTANNLKFADGTVLKAGSGADSALTIAAPEAFGFVGNRQAAAVNFTNLDASGTPGARVKIALAPGSTLGVSGAAVQFTSVDVSAPQGVLRVAATGNAAVELPVGGTVSVPLAGSIDASDAKLSTAGTGSIQLAGGRVRLGNGTAISGNGGGVIVTADTLSLSGSTKITTEPPGQGNAGSVTINTNDLSLLSGSQIGPDPNGAQKLSGSANITIQGLSGNGSSARSVLISGNGTVISSRTDGAAAGGNVRIAARQITVEDLGDITVGSSGKGNAGDITIAGDSVAVRSGGRIEASTSGEGNGGSVAIRTTGDVVVSGVSADGQTRSGIFAKTQTPTGGGGTGGGGGGGGGGGTTGKPGNAGNIAIAAQDLVLTGGAQIDSSTTSGGAGGSVAITTRGSITIAGSSTRLTSDATRGDGAGGSISLAAKTITVRDDASVTAATGGKGDAGNIALTALDRLLLQSGGTVTTSTSGSGKGGTIVVQASQVVLDGPGTAITASVLRPFADLTVTINILHPNDGDLIVQLDSPSGTRVALLSRVGGTGDDFADAKFDDQATKSTTAGSAPFTGTFKPREPMAQLVDERAAGDWILNVRDQASGNVGALQNWTLRIGNQTFQSTGPAQQIPDNATLQSTISVANPASRVVRGTGEAPGIGGDVTVNTGSMTVRNGAAISAVSTGSGRGGVVTVNATGPVVLRDSLITTDTLGSGPAGDVMLNAQSLLIDRGKISSSSSGRSSGNAGDVGIKVRESLTLVNGGSLSSSTQSARGAAGSIEVNAKRVAIDGPASAILADAVEGSSGQTGSVTVNATGAIDLSNGGSLSIHSHATVGNPRLLTPTLLSLSAPDITLTDAKISAESTGNVNASDIRIRFSGRLTIDPSSITTSANQGNGGDIDIIGGQTIVLQDSQITTSVLGTHGNGGDINIQADSLVMQSGFIQANTAGVGASGGNVNIRVRTLVPSGSFVLIGGNTPLAFQPGVFGPNVIQAAAPTGLSGTIETTTPTLDVAGHLIALNAGAVDLARVAKDPCRLGTGNSFTSVGRGGLRPTATGMIRPEGAAARVAFDGTDPAGLVPADAQRAYERLSALSDCR